MPRRRSSSGGAAAGAAAAAGTPRVQSDAPEIRRRAVAVSSQECPLLAANAYRAVVAGTDGSGSNALVWMSESAMLEAPICVSQLVSVSVAAENSADSQMLETLCSEQCGSFSDDKSGALFAIGVAWPSKKLIKNAIRLSRQLAQTLGYPPIGSALLISSLRAKCSSDIGKQLHIPSCNTEYTVLLQECKQISLVFCEGLRFPSAQEASGFDTSSSFSSPSKFSSSLGSGISPLKNTASPGSISDVASPLEKSSLKLGEDTAAAARSYLESGSQKMKEVVEKVAARWLYGRLLLLGSMVGIPICGTECVFHVIAAESMRDETSSIASLSSVQDSQDTEEFARAKLEQLSLKTSTSPQALVYVSHRTVVNIVRPQPASRVSEGLQESSPAAVSQISQVSSSSGTSHLYSSLGGLSEEVATLKEIVEHSLLRPEILVRFGVKRTKGVLLYGPPGTGKTTLAQAVASEAGVKMFVINGPEIVTEYYGESEAALKAVFDSAERHAPSVVFIDELDAITPERKEGSEQLGQRMMATLLTLMDGVDLDRVLVIAATNRPESIDPALRRHGRFDYEVEIGVPTPSGRLEILQVHLSRMKHNLSHKDVQTLAAETHGFVGADLSALCNEAALGALRRHVVSRREFGSNKLAQSSLYVTWEDLELAKGQIRPSAMREVILEVPKVRWSDIGGQDDVKQQLKEIVEWPQKHGDSFVRIGTTPPLGVLLYGPPGCSKTLIARAVAAETGLNFIAVKGPELFSKWVGESEKAVRALFARAKAAAPSVVFFDEIDGLAIPRSSGHGDGTSVEDRVMTQLLVELDGVTPRNSVSVIAATNRPDKLDAALLRPGRFDRLIYVGPPDKAARQQIFEIHLRRTPCSRDVSTEALASRTDSYTGADIAAVCREAALAALEEDLKTELVGMSHFDTALTRVLPSQYDLGKSLFAQYQRG